MILKVEVATNNAAFHAPDERHGPDVDYLRDEVAAVLRQLRNKVTRLVDPTARTEDHKIILFDGNGQQVGAAWFEED